MKLIGIGILYLKVGNFSLYPTSCWGIVMFTLQEEPEVFINKTTLENPEVGGAVSFEGRVRNLNKGKK